MATGDDTLWTVLDASQTSPSGSDSASWRTRSASNQRTIRRPTSVARRTSAFASPSPSKSALENSASGVVGAPMAIAANASGRPASSGASPGRASSCVRVNAQPARRTRAACAADSALRLNVHFHTLALDGVYVRSEAGALDFHRLGEPTRADVERVAAWTHAGLLRVLARHGRSLEGIEHAPDAMRADEPVLASCYGASAADVQLLGDAPGSRTDKLVRPLRALCAPGPRGPLAEVGGVNIHAKVCVEGPEALERLCRYTARPLLAQDRLDLHGDGRVRYRFKTTWRDGTCAILLDPLDFIARLCALIGRPGRHAVRYHGVLAGNATLRAQVVPGRAPVHGEQLALLPPADGGPPAPRPPARRPWAQLLRRVFAVDVLACPTCGGRMRLLEVVTKGHLARRVARAPPRRGQLDLDLGAARHHAT